MAARPQSRFLLCLLLLGLAGLPRATLARDPVHTLRGGQLLSADVIMEMVRDVTPGLEETLVGGIWSTQCWDGYTDDIDDPDTGLLTVNTLTDIDYENVSDVNDGCIFGDSRNFNNFAVNQPTFDRFKIIGERAFLAAFHYTYDDGSGNQGSDFETWSVPELTENSVLLISDNATVRMTRINTRSAIPTEPAVSASGRAITLSWTDASSDETGFRILRKDSVSGDFAEIGTASAGATSYSDTVSAAGTYWYRVRAVNANGDSLGSIVVSVTVE